MVVHLSELLEQRELIQAEETPKIIVPTFLETLAEEAVWDTVYFKLNALMR